MISTLIVANGAVNLINSIRDSWVGPLFLFGVGCVAVWYAIKGKVRELLIALALAVLAATVLYGTDLLFGPNGVFTNLGKSTAQKISN